VERVILKSTTGILCLNIDTGRTLVTAGCENQARSIDKRITRITDCSRVAAAIHEGSERHLISTRTIFNDIPGITSDETPTASINYCKIRSTVHAQMKGVILKATAGILCLNINTGPTLVTAGCENQARSIDKRITRITDCSRVAAAIHGGSERHLITTGAIPQCTNNVCVAPHKVAILVNHGKEIATKCRLSDATQKYH
jgi:hypothetical protein